MFSWGEKHFFETCLNETHFIQKVLFPSYIHDHSASLGESFHASIDEVPFSGLSLTAGQSILGSISAKLELRKIIWKHLTSSTI